VTAAAAFDRITKTYGRVPAVRGVSLSVPAGGAFALLGPNRAGKTTLIKLLLGLAHPTTGTAHRLGAPVRDRGTLARVGYMHENHAFPRYLSAGELLHFYGGLSGVSAEALDSRVPVLLKRVGLDDRAREPIARFSKGMVQRLGLAQALLNDPDLLILDEPTEGLDLTGRKLLREVVRGMTAAGKTVLLVSHVLPEVEELCDRAAVIVNGRLAFDGTLAALKGERSLEAALTRLYESGAAE
jgi:ABC-2 type transport system ATP-binding protein